MLKYRIAWICLLTGEEGHGGWVESHQKENLLEEINRYNEEYKGILDYWLEESE